MSSISRITQPLKPPPATVPWWRKCMGAVFLCAMVLTAIVFGLGAWNPWNNVVLLSYFADPFRGVIAIAVLGYVALWLLLPVRNEAVDRRRLSGRLALIVVAMIGLAGYGLYGTHYYDYESREIVRTADGSRAVAMVKRWDYVDPRYHVFTASGVATSDVADIGPVCGAGDEIAFRDNQTIEISNAYGDFVIPLDPGTGQPLDYMVTCSELRSEAGG
ncbi:MAG TPA: hypothetical protein H9881_07925 [Candidatus Stackebrandtia excrementipullorum]|nr:hypothetical protein [Candidatus Stackebrandtia excrementipullorum]